MDKFIKVQTDLNSRISKGLINFKKSPKDRSSNICYVETRLEDVEKLWKQFLDNHDKALGTDYDLGTSSYIVNNLYEMTEEVYFAYKSELKSKIAELSNSSIVNTQTLDITSQKPISVSLPKIKIPYFSGKYTEWTSFRDLYISLVHKNSSLDIVQKLHYLKCHLTGEAESLIRHVLITDQNYEKCWKLLESRYNNKKYLLNCIMKRFFSQRVITQESSSALKDLLDTTSDCLSALNNLGIETNNDVFGLYFVIERLDNTTRLQWELKNSCESSSNDIPNFNDFFEFIENRFKALEHVESTFKPKLSNHRSNTGTVQVNKNQNSFHVVDNIIKCEFCSEAHKLCFCKEFSKQDVNVRRDFVSKNKLCFNCLGSNHSVKFCRNSTLCRICNKKHHSLIHQKPSSSSNVSPQSSLSCIEGETQDQVEEVNSFTSYLPQKKTNTQILLATALVRVESRFGNNQVLRALLDQGSQASFITEAMVQYLGLNKISTKGFVKGIGGDLIAKDMVEIKLKSMINPNFNLSVHAYVIKNITSFIPAKTVQFTREYTFSNIQLADPGFHTPNKIDILLGAEPYSQVIQNGVMKGPPGTPVAQCTTLGWILSGPVKGNNISSNNIISMHVKEFSDDNCLKLFWELESVQNLSKNQILTEEERACEDLFNNTTCRDASGRYVVKLPFRDENPGCRYSQSREVAVQRLHSLERRFKNNPHFQERYSAVINEYVELGHMIQVNKEDENKEHAVYLPHHAVIRDDKTTSKVRIVFDASAKGLNGISLNSSLLIGPKLQPDLRHILINWRQYPIAIVGDIVKMFRQVFVSSDDRDYQRILWRDSNKTEIKEYQLTTVTFGTASAPYLAVKSLQQLTFDEGHNHPQQVVSRVIKDFYMDDFMSGSYTLEEGKELFREMNALLLKGGFTLQKWNSNNIQLLEEMSSINQSQGDLCNHEIKLDTLHKILGLTWNRGEDTLQYTVTLPPLTTPVTKRKVISDISRLFDPLGWISPVIITAKIFIQKLWVAGIGWDEELSDNLLKEWLTYRDQLLHLTSFHIPRWVNTNLDDTVKELHGFCDASTLAYAATVYLRVVDKSGNIRVTLVASKTRVAPVKQISIPRLELCGALLLKSLLMEVAAVLEIPVENIRAWSDSTVVLAWLKGHPSRWKTFVANRASEIVSSLNYSHWSHIKTHQNPADSASRGLPAIELKQTKMWLNGPDILYEREIPYSDQLALNETNLEERISSFVGVDASNKNQEKFWTRFSSFCRLIRVTAYCRRFLYQKKNKRVGFLTKTELDEAKLCCIRQCQIIELEEYSEILDHGFISFKGSKFKSLNPFIDSEGLLRVLGRIQMSDLEYNKIHPICLPHDSHFTDLVIAHAHLSTLHGGPQLMLNYLRSTYWIIGAKSLVKRHIHKCVRCVRYNSKAKHQFMGQLPSCRIQPCRPFLRSGVDYAGPVQVRASKGRGHSSYKGYICVFVCMSTRAIHLEIVSDLTSQGFINAFKRFVSRRGHCTEVWSDNGTNFIGAAKELKVLFKAERSKMISEIAETLATNGTKWHFIPPHTPNFGGLWESAVKSTKYHLKRVIGDSTLTFEEMSTLLSQVEACLNSRPISIINESSDPMPLTPGHFLIGEPLVTVPEFSYENHNFSSLKRWQFTQSLLQRFWRRWSSEYLSNLVHRYRWSKKIPEPQEGDVVLVMEDDLPPAKWLFGRVVQKHVGKDNLTRVVTLKCKNSVIKRPTSKLCILPIAE